MYKIVFENSDISKYYFENELLFISKRKRKIIGSINNVFKNDELIFTFSDFSFTILFWKVKILFQNFEDEIVLEKQKGRYTLSVKDSNVSVKLSDNPFKKTIGRVTDNGVLNATIKRKLLNGRWEYYVDFISKSDIDIYSLILVAVYFVGIEDSI